MRRHTADVQARRQDGGAGRALRHLGDPVGKFFPLKILAGILYFPVPGVEKKKKLPVPRVTEISTVHLFISNLTRAVWGLLNLVPVILHRTITGILRKIREIEASSMGVETLRGYNLCQPPGCNPKIKLRKRRTPNSFGGAADEVENRSQVTSVVLYFVWVRISPYKPP